MTGGRLRLPARLCRFRCARGEACEAAAALEGVLVLNLAPESEILTLLALLGRLCAMLTRLAHMGDPPVQRRSASVGGSGSVSDQRQAASVGGSRERDGRARSARGGQGGLSVPKSPRGVRPAAPGALTPSPYAFRLPRTPH